MRGARCCCPSLAASRCLPLCRTTLSRPRTWHHWQSRACPIAVSTQSTCCATIGLVSALVVCDHHGSASAPTTAQVQPSELRSMALRKLITEPTLQIPHVVGSPICGVACSVEHPVQLWEQTVRQPPTSLGYPAGRRDHRSTRLCRVDRPHPRHMPRRVGTSPLGHTLPSFPGAPPAVRRRELRAV